MLNPFDNQNSDVIVIMTPEGEATGNRINLRTRTIILYSYIDEMVAVEISDVIETLDSSRDPINVKINSVGGIESAVQSIVTELLFANNEILVDIVGEAYSGAAMIALTGDHIRMSSYGLFMLHYPSWETDSKTLKEHKLDVKVATEYFERMMKDLLSDTNISIDEFRKLAKDDWYMTPKVCLKRGIINEIY